MQTGDSQKDTMEQLRRELKLTRIFCGIFTAAVIVLMIGIFWLVSVLQPFYVLLENAGEALEQLNVSLSEVDWEELNAVIGEVDWEQVSQSLGELDVEAINQAVEGLNTEELSETLKNLNDVAAMFEGIGSSFSSLFGNNK